MCPQIIDINSGEACGPNQAGEMWIHTPGLMKGYLNRPQEYSAAVDKDGWLHTGERTDLCLIWPQAATLFGV